MKVHEFEGVVWERDTIRIVIRAPKMAEVDDFTFAYAANQKISLSRWWEVRVEPYIGNYDFVIIDGTGDQPNGNNHVGTIRKTYGRA